MRAGEDRLRASDAERDEAIGQLRHRFAEGRLSQETFLYRMDAAMRAKDHADLSDLFTDLPQSDGLQVAGPTGGTWLARLWHSAGGWLGGVGRRGRGPLTTSAVPMPQDVMSLVYAGPAQPGPAAMMYVPLTEAKPQSLCLPRQTDRRFTIGRAPSCDFTVADLSVSRWHARLHKEEDSWLLSDLGSTNGTTLNGWRVTSAVPVQPGDKVCFGSAAYVIIERPLAVVSPDSPPGAS